MSRLNQTSDRRSPPVTDTSDTARASIIIYLITASQAYKEFKIYSKNEKKNKFELLWAGRGLG